MKCSLGISNFLEESLVFPILLFSSISLHWSLRKSFLSLLAIRGNSAFKWVYLSFSPLPFTSLLFWAICKASSDNHFAFLHFFFLRMVLITGLVGFHRTIQLKLLQHYWLGHRLELLWSTITEHWSNWPHGPQPCLIQWNYEPYYVGPPTMDGSWWRVLTKCGPLEKRIANHFSILALRTPWTVWKAKKIWHWKMNSQVGWCPICYWRRVEK